MSKRAKNNQRTEEPVKPPRRVLDRRRTGATHDGLPASYRQACELAQTGSYDKARRLYTKLEKATREPDSHLRALIRNDLAVLAALEGRYDEAQQGWKGALELDQGCLQARLNRDLVQAELELAGPHPQPEPAASNGTDSPNPHPPARTPIRVAILSFLFNWPSTGGGNMHTAGLAQFLARAGYEVKHYYARYPAWGIGRVTNDEYLRGAEPETFGQDTGGVGDPRRTPASEALEFDEPSWNVSAIQARYRRAVDEFEPDYVVITDAWNMKPLLAEAVRDYPCLLLFQAQENLCPLNNLRLLGVGPDKVEQCPRNQLATPEICHRCLAERGQHSGALHQRERALAGVGTPEYDQKLRRSLREAEGVLVLNPITAAMVEPYASRVRIVPWGIDPARFPWPPAEEGKIGRPAVRAEGGDPSGARRPAPSAVAPSADSPVPSAVGSEAEVEASGRASGTPINSTKPVATLFMAAVAGELIKGFHVAHEACRILRQTRSDFELVVTFDPPGPGRIDEFTRSVGWCSQAELPRHYRAADICLVPTIAQDALSITSVEAMAVGIPVIASRVGGLPYTVADGLNGLLCEPGEPADLARQIARLLDDPALRRRMGLAGRKRFEEEFTWETVIERYWRPLLLQRRVGR